MSPQAYRFFVPILAFSYKIHFHESLKKYATIFL